MLGANAMELIFAVIIIAVQVVISVFRWRTILVAIDAVLPFWQTLRIYLIGLFFNQVLPSSVGGDAVRIYKVFRLGFPIRTAVHGVMLERIATVLGLLFLVALAAPFFKGQGGAADTNWMISFSILVLACGIGGIIILMVLDRIPHIFSAWRVVRALSNLAADTRKVFLSPPHAIQAIGWGVLGHIAIAIAVFFIAKSIDLAVTIIDCIVLMPPVMLVTTLPISIAGWGVREGAMVAAFALVGVTSEDALVLSFMFGMIAILSAIPGGITWLLTSDKKIELRTIKKRQTTTSPYEGLSG